MKIHNPSVTGSLVLSGSLTATGNITTLGTLVAQTLVVQDITSSRDFVTGSTKFGTLSTNTHEFTGSVGISGSLSLTGNATFGGTVYTTQYRSFGDNTLSTSNTASSIFLQVGNTNYFRLLGSNGNITIQNGGTYTDNGYRLQVNGAGSVSGSLFVSGSSIFSGSVNISSSLVVNGTATIKSASLDYQQNLAVATGSFQTIVSAATGSFRAAIFDYVTFSGSVARAGTLYSTWGGTSVEWFENYTADVNGSTSPVTLQAVLSSGNIVLQAGISGSAWSVRSLVRLL
jgi:cytoskeletal protein CcmA (bactofilin family)